MDDAWISDGATVARGEEQSSANRKVGGLTPNFPRSHAKVEAEIHVASDPFVSVW